jgi:hypothetical protein
VATLSLREINMRKVLLTTTALVALGGVSAASALDISGFQRFIYSTWDDTASTEASGNNDSELVNYMRIQLNHDVTTDSGLNIGMYTRINNVADGSYEHIGISGDFGTLSIGNYDTPGGNMYSSLIYDGKFVDDIDQTFAASSGNLASSAAAALQDEASTYAVSYTLPSMAGFTLQVAQGDSGTTTQADAQEIGLSYSGDMGGVGITAHVVSATSDDTTGAANDEADNQEMGVVLTSGAFKFRGTTANNETVGIDGVTDVDIESNEYSLEYNVDSGWDVALISFSSKDTMDTTNNSKVDQTIFATRYTIAPGVLAYASYADFDYEGSTNNSGSQTNIGLRVNF